ncbi:hypothetical protein U3516DRAFT_670302 [Neocallimastix sp. 'constans']
MFLFVAEKFNESIEYKSYKGKDNGIISDTSLSPAINIIETKYPMFPIEKKSQSFLSFLRKIISTAQRASNIFAHGIFKISSNCGYQVFITRTYVKELDSECLEYKYNNFLEFLEYFEITYLKDYEIKYWNYYDDIEHITINASELFNNYLNDLFPKEKSHFYTFLLTLKKCLNIQYYLK